MDLGILKAIINGIHVAKATDASDNELTNCRFGFIIPCTVTRFVIKSLWQRHIILRDHVI